MTFCCYVEPFYLNSILHSSGWINDETNYTRLYLGCSGLKSFFRVCFTLCLILEVLHLVKSYIYHFSFFQATRSL